MPRTSRQASRHTVHRLCGAIRGGTALLRSKTLGIQLRANVLCMGAHVGDVSKSNIGGDLPEVQPPHKECEGSI